MALSKIYGVPIEDISKINGIPKSSMSKYNDIEIEQQVPQNYTFDGTDGYMSTDLDLSTHFTGTNISYLIVARVNVVEAGNYVVSNDGSYHNFHIVFDGTSTLRSELEDNALDSFLIKGVVEPYSGSQTEWHQWLFTHESGSFLCYLDGLLYDTEKSGQDFVGFDVGTPSLQIGGDTALGSYFNGDIRYFQMYDTTLSASDAVRLVTNLDANTTNLKVDFRDNKTATRWKDDANGYTATVNGGVTIEIPQIESNNYFSFDASTTDYFTTTYDLDTISDFSIVVKAKFNDTSTDRCIVGAIGSSTRVQFRLDASNQIVCSFTDGTTTTSETFDWSGKFDTNWHNIVVTYEYFTTTAEIKLYIDGLQFGSTYTDTTSPFPGWAETRLLQVGRRGSNSGIMNGDISHVQFYDAVLTADEIFTLAKNIDGVSRNKQLDLNQTQTVTTWTDDAVGGNDGTNAGGVIRNGDVYPQDNAGSIYDEFNATTSWTARTGGWGTLTVDSGSNAYIGDYSIKLKSTDNTTSFYGDLDFDVISGEYYQLNFHYIFESGSDVRYPRIVPNTNLTGSDVNYPTDTSGSWSVGTPQTFLATGTGTGTIRFYPTPDANGIDNQFWLDNISITKTNEVYSQGNAASIDVEVDSIGDWTTAGGTVLLTSTTESMEDGNYSLKMEANSTDGFDRGEYEFSTVSGSSYTVSWWNKFVVNTGTPDARTSVWTGFVSSPTIAFEDDTDWTYHTVDVVSNSTTGLIRMYPVGDSHDGLGDVLYIDKMSITKTT